MGLQKLKNLRQREGGFTIVELLIVIVVIGILAAITIVAYNGITAKAYSTTARSNAESVQKVAESYNADNGAYPTAATIVTYSNSSQLPSALKIVATGASGALTGAGIIDGTSSTICSSTNIASPGPVTATCLNSTWGTKDIIVVNKGTTGDCIGYFDYPSSTTLWVYAGNASVTSAVSNAIVCA
jgi:prepilin-type N-terminal cleavage/methylation domain-containing protein